MSQFVCESHRCVNAAFQASKEDIGGRLHPFIISSMELRLKHRLHWFDMLRPRSHRSLNHSVEQILLRCRDIG